MSSGAEDHVLLRAFVDELARCGMRAACTSPGSRCAPLVLSLAAEPRLRCYSHVDERCAGFFALGLAKASALPVAVTCTSGTAAAELLPAVIEAREARVPLLVLTADRPPELRDSGAGQTIDQLKLYGSAAKWFFEVAPDDARVEDVRWIRALACRAYWTTLEGRPGAVHLNFPLREPLVCDDAPAGGDGGRMDGRPYLQRSPTPRHHDGELAALRELVAGSRRGVLIAGRHERPAATGAGSLGEVAARFCAAAGWPLLADPLSGARRGSAAIAHYDALLRDAGFAASRTPDLIVRVGDLPVSKPLRGWLAGMHDVSQVSLDCEGAWQDPAAVLARSFALDPAAALSSLTGASAALDGEWLDGWRSADARAAQAIVGVLDGVLSEPVVAAELGVLLPERATVFVASSMPVRDIETFWPVREDPPRTLCNRGANGIDGTISAAFGASAHDRGPVVALIGDVALAHDVGGLLAARRLGLKLTIVLLDNGGGGIFDFLPVSRASGARVDDIYERHIATPTGLDFAKAAELYDLAHERVRDVSGLREALERALGARGSSIVEVRTERAANVQLHERVWRAVSDALRD